MAAVAALPVLLLERLLLALQAQLALIAPLRHQQWPGGKEVKLLLAVLAVCTLEMLLATASSAAA